MITLKIIAHFALNPILVLLFLKAHYTDVTTTNGATTDVGTTQDTKKREPVLQTWLVIPLSSAFLYSFWFGAYYLILKWRGRPFDADQFFGLQQGVWYFFPYLFAAYLILNKTVIEARLVNKTWSLLNKIGKAIGIAMSLYIMFVFYLYWLAQP